MPLHELFPNPTVKQVIFQIRYPNLFYIESKIGEFQIEILDLFPESSIGFRKPVLITDLGADAKIEDLQSKLGGEVTQKIWKFSSPKNYVLNVLNDALDINSQYHKTYDNPDSETRFRDIIETVLDKFFKIMRVPIITRIGLRYIDECPLPSKDNRTYLEHFNSSFNLEKFPIENASEMVFNAIVNRGDYSLRYIESLKKEGDSYKVILDFDAFAKSITPSDCLRVTDQLHELTIDEFTNTIREPIYRHMRGQ